MYDELTLTMILTKDSLPDTSYANKLADLFNSLAGGYTVIDSMGAWLDDTKEEVVEKSALLFCTAPADVIGTLKAAVIEFMRQHSKEKALYLTVTPVIGNSIHQLRN